MLGTKVVNSPAGAIASCDWVAQWNVKEVVRRVLHLCVVLEVDIENWHFWWSADMPWLFFPFCRFFLFESDFIIWCDRKFGFVDVNPSPCNQSFIFGGSD